MRRRRVQPLLLGLRLPHLRRGFVSLFEATELRTLAARRSQRSARWSRGSARRGGTPAWRSRRSTLGAQQLVKTAKGLPTPASGLPNRSPHAEAPQVKRLGDFRRGHVLHPVSADGNLPEFKRREGARGATRPVASRRHRGPAASQRSEGTGGGLLALARRLGRRGSVAASRRLVLGGVRTSKGSQERRLIDGGGWGLSGKGPCGHSSPL